MCIKALYDKIIDEAIIKKKCTKEIMELFLRLAILIGNTEQDVDIKKDKL